MKPKRTNNQPGPKWRFAIGTTSLVPGTNRRAHYLIADVDDRNVAPTLDYLQDELAVQTIALYPTPRGYHVYTDEIMAWGELLYTLRRVPGVDGSWLRIGAERGYLYLADKRRVDLSWPVVRMIIHYHAK